VNHAGFCASLILLYSTHSFAGNAEPFYLSGESALTAGATTSSHSGAGSLWYNPAQLANGTEDSVDIAVSGYAVRFGGTPRFQSSPETATEDSAGASIQAVPTAAAYSRRIGEWHIGFGLFVPVVSNTDPRSFARFGNQRGTALFDASYERTEYYAGIGLARKLSPKASLGFSLFGYLAKEFANATLAAKSGDLFQILSTSWEQDTYGIQATSGLTLEPTRNLRLGLTLRSPVIRLAAAYEGTSALGKSTGANVQSTIESLDTSPSESRLVVVPPSMSLGLSWMPQTDWLVAIDTRLRAPLGDGRARLLDATVDIRLGAKKRFGNTLTIGGGLFSDRSATPNGQLDTSSIHFYGATLAVELATPYRVREETEGNSPAPPQGLRVSSVFALSYGFGVGSVNNLMVDVNDPSSLSFVSRGLVAHQFVATLSTSLANLLTP
jgi:long-subunit fatty acid transport protein